MSEGYQQQAAAAAIQTHVVRRLRVSAYIQSRRSDGKQDLQLSIAGHLSTIDTSLFMNEPSKGFHVKQMTQWNGFTIGAASYS